MELLMQGLVLMVIGMATVFAFLVLLILSMNVSAAVCGRFDDMVPEEKQAAPSAADPTAEVAVALAAIRAKRG